ncbi:hypothetical protein PR202_gb26352 [Eleusine coracana subsp. coracana]|uniref:Leucine-rich repeat-containing N-terminal plant-type domain-containing protein n=1 Tax=Eleusine coracana subsp. coracana TaxID=191504 RepID=A0AAV5FRL6_ELECO|nr:hypothetical protein PR202_gb26352 [Eleusine coracana subsp. coracana]
MAPTILAVKIDERGDGDISWASRKREGALTEALTVRKQRLEAHCQSHAGVLAAALFQFLNLIGRAGTDCCRWMGVRCANTDGRVISLNLGGRGLESGGLHPALFDLTSLKYLNLAYNHFNRSQLPPTGFEWLTKLTHLNLSRCSFSGQNANSLQSLNLNQNQFHGELPDNIKEGCLFEALDFSSNWIEGKLPRSLVACKNLVAQPPQEEKSASVGVLDLLVGLNMSHNSLTGPIPSQLSHLTQLEALDLSSSELYGEIPLDLKTLDALTVLNLSNNKLVGSIPESPHFMTFSNSSFLGNDAFKY